MITVQKYTVENSITTHENLPHSFLGFQLNSLWLWPFCVLRTNELNALSSGCQHAVGFQWNKMIASVAICQNLIGMTVKDFLPSKIYTGNISRADGIISALYLYVYLIFDLPRTTFCDRWDPYEAVSFVLPKPSWAFFWSPLLLESWIQGVYTSFRLNRRGRENFPSNVIQQHCVLDLTTLENRMQSLGRTLSVYLVTHVQGYKQDRFSFSLHWHWI